MLKIYWIEITGIPHYSSSEVVAKQRISVEWNEHATDEPKAFCAALDAALWDEKAKFREVKYWRFL